MRADKTNIFIQAISLAMIIILAIQINWMIEANSTGENLITEKANMVKSRTTEDLSNDVSGNKNLEAGDWEKEYNKIDSLLKHYTKYYDFNEDYTFEVIRAKPVIFKGEFDPASQNDPNVQACYNKELDRLKNKNGWELKLNFHHKDKNLLSSMSLPLVISSVLILLVLLLFWKTILALKTEKRISEHTTDFLNNMTHEFKTPLTNIALAGKMISRESTLKQEEKVKHYSGIILAENEKLRLQVEQVLSMTALERGEIPLRKEELDFHELIKNCVEPITVQIEDKHGELKLNLRATDHIVTGDKTHLTNVLGNLIDNAIKYSGEKPEITIETITENRDLVVMVSDKGIGIDKEHQKKVFDKYFRVHTGDVHDVKGFGLGLAYVKKIIGLHGGMLELESETGKGSTFIIKLPHA
ncbi:MAG: sensor histidine kinase [Bacteroidia bacterium]